MMLKLQLGRRTLTLIFFCCLHSVDGQCGSTELYLVAKYNAYETFTSTNYPSNHLNNQNCYYKIDSGASDRRVAVSYLNFHLETNYDFLYVYDGDSTTATRLGRDDGVIQNKFYISTGRYMYFRFSSDYSVTRSGFNIQYFSVLDSSKLHTPGCGDWITVDSSTHDQYALSTFPNPFTYIFQTECTWTISATSSSDQFSLALFFTDTDSFSGCDQINKYGISLIYGGSLFYQGCGLLPDNAVVFTGSGASNLTVTFRAPIVNNIDRGFMFAMDYIGTSVSTTVPIPTTPSVSSSCGSQSNPTLLTATNVTKYVTSPQYPGTYSNNLNCWWRITASRSNMGVTLSINQVNTENSDYIKIYDGTSSSFNTLGTFSGTVAGSSDINSTGRSLTILFITDSSTTDTGFYFGYEENPTAIPSCAPAVYTPISASTSSMDIESHTGYGTVSYSNDVQSFWLITKPSEAHTLKGEFTSFRIEDATSCRYDYVKIYSGACEDSSNRIVFICGSQENYKFEHQYGKYVLVQFYTDSSVTFAGWKLNIYITEPDADSAASEDEGFQYYWIIIVVIVLILVVICSGFCKFVYNQSRFKRVVRTNETTGSKPTTQTKKNIKLSSIVLVASKLKPKNVPEKKIKRYKTLKQDSNQPSHSVFNQFQPPSSNLSNPVPPMQHSAYMNPNPQPMPYPMQPLPQPAPYPPQQILYQQQFPNQTPQNIPSPFTYTMPPQLR